MSYIQEEIELNGEDIVYKPVIKKEDVYIKLALLKVASEGHQLFTSQD